MVRGRTAIAAKERKFVLAKVAVGKKVTKPQNGGIESLIPAAAKSVEV